jgi:NADH:ubiquinone oxidoreductase subunit H
VQLQTAIVDRIVVDATRPFSRVSIATTAATICRSPEELMAIAVRLVETGQLPFRVDAAGNALVAKYTDERSSVFAKAMALAATMEGDTKMALLRASLMAGGYKVTISKAEQAAAREAASQAVSLTPREMGGSGYLGRGGTRR